MKKCLLKSLFLVQCFIISNLCASLSDNFKQLRLPQQIAAVVIPFVVPAATVFLSYHLDLQRQKGCDLLGRKKVIVLESNLSNSKEDHTEFINAFNAKFELLKRLKSAYSPEISVKYTCLLMFTGLGLLIPFSMMRLKNHVDAPFV